MPQAVLLLVLAVGAIGFLRSAYLVSLWSVYLICGTETDAVIERSESYGDRVRKLRPTVHLVSRYRGTYRFDIADEDGTVIHVRGSFDTGKFGPAKEGQYSPGEKISVIYLQRAPGRSRPAQELNSINGIIALLIMLASLVLIGVSVFLIALRRRMATSGL